MPSSASMRAIAPILFVMLAGCSAVNERAEVDRRADVLHGQADAREASADAALSAAAALRVQESADREASEQRVELQFAAGVAAQHAAAARVQPAMRACVVANARRMAIKSGGTADDVVAGVLRLCRPEIAAVARTVELAHMPSDGLSDDLTIRLRPEVRQLVVTSRAQAGRPGVGDGAAGSRPLAR